MFVSTGVVMSRSVTLVKGKNNMIGISIGGGAPMCPVLYVVQVCCDAHHPCILLIVYDHMTWLSWIRKNLVGAPHHNTP